jgi:hypothetical protein
MARLRGTGVVRGKGEGKGRGGRKIHGEAGYNRGRG